MIGRSGIGNILSAGIIAAVCASTDAASAQMSYATFAEPLNAFASQTEAWNDAVRERTGGAVYFDLYLGGALLSGRDTLRGIGGGVAQAGQHVATYAPSENPLWTSLADLAFKVPDPLVVAFASTDYMLTDPEGKGEWLASNVVALEGFATTPYHFMCKGGGVDSLQDLRGKRIRTAGGPWSRFVKSIDAVDVNLPSSEAYTALERGVIDCVLVGADQVIGGAVLKDLLGSIVDLDVGLFFPGAALVVNVDTWNAIDPDHRRIMLDESAKAVVRRELHGYMKLRDEGMAAARESGVGINVPTQDLVDAYSAFVSNIDGEIIVAGKTIGIDGLEKEIADFTALLDKWAMLLANVERSDEEALTALLKAEVYSKVDVDSLSRK